MNRPYSVGGMSYAEYAETPGINASALKVAHQYSLAHVRAYLDGTFQKESAALDFGKSFHALVLEGREDFVVKPASYEGKDGPRPWNGNASACREWIAAQEGKLVLSLDDVDRLNQMHHAVRPHLPVHGRAELSVFAERKGVSIKARIDFLATDDDAAVYDLKTCRSAHPEQFMRDAMRLGYHIQAAFSLDILRKIGIDRQEFRFIAVECEPPFAVCVLSFKDTDLSALRMGRRRYRKLFADIAAATKSGRWESYGSHEAEAFIPPWMMPELEQTA